MTIITTVVMVIKCFSHLSVQCSTPALHLMLLRVLIWVIVMLCLARISHMPCRSPTLKRRAYLQLFKYMHNAIQTFYYEVYLFIYFCLLEASQSTNYSISVSARKCQLPILEVSVGSAQGHLTGWSKGNYT